MDTTDSEIAPMVADRTPVHLWIVGVLALLWTGFGGFDYLMTMTNNEAYLAQFTEAQRDYFQSFPGWVMAAWAFGVWGGVAGSILLLLRSRHAVTAFAISLAGLAASSAYQYLLDDTDLSAIMPENMQYMVWAIWIVAILLLVYAWRQRRSGVLR
ncbi:MAG: hypothetical protein ABR601_00330 [Parasphingopyxis sp.]|nr:hypothetical protein [Sphingomonadales bacterium]